MSQQHRGNRLLHLGGLDQGVMIRGESSLTRP